MSNFILPTLPIRKNILEKFFTFVVTVEDVNERQRFTWTRDSKLRNHLNSHKQREPIALQLQREEDEKSALQYFLAICQNEAQPNNEKLLAKNFIAAYLETPRYNAAIARFKKFKDFGDDPQEAWTFYLELAGKVASDVEIIAKILKKHKKYKLEQHLQFQLTSHIRDLYYTAKKQGKYSRWYLLKDASDTKLKKALQAMGIDNREITRFIDGRFCLFKVYERTGKRWLEPTPKHYQEAANYYNRHFPKTKQSLNEQTFKDLIVICHKALDKISETVEKYVDFYDEKEIAQYAQFFEESALPDPAIEFDDRWLDEKVRESRDFMLAILLNTLDKFEEKERKMLFLRYGLDLSEPKIGPKININQSNVNRGCKRCQKDLLASIAEWAKNQLQIDVKAIAELEDYALEWLKQHYREKLHAILQPAFQRLNSESVEILKLHYGQQVEENAIEEKYNLTEKEVAKKIAIAQKQLLDELLAWSQTKLNISLESESKKLAALVETWLSNVSYNEINQ